MPLDEYRRKRDFAATPEPAGAPGAIHEGAGRFVIHKHAARALHYDLRLEISGVYASWAVPKGPSLDTHDRHLAVHVEDHPLEYGEFEGVIPAGEYGGGTVMIWDFGTFRPLLDPVEGLAKGSLKFVLEGHKLHGAWALVRMKPRPGERQESWLLIKERDDAVRPRDEYDVVAELPDSAASGRTMEQIAASGVQWTAEGAGGAPATGAPDADPPATRPANATDSAGTATPPAAGDRAPDPFPADAPVQLATLVRSAPEGDEWVHEVKFDGYRLRLALQDGRARALTRTGQDWSDRFPTVIAAVEALPATSALLDGEVVVPDAEGRSDFGLLQQALSSGDAAAMRFEAFDLLYLDGEDLRAETLLERTARLAKLLAGAPAGGPLHAVQHFAGRGPAYHAAACDLLLEGSVSKRGDRPWVGGRTRDWLKVKCLARQEFVVGGWTDPAGSRAGFGSLLLGVHDAEGALRYAGKVGTGFTERTLDEVHARLARLSRETSPFADAPALHGAHWVTPKLVAEVAFREWTRDGLVRQASFKGLRDDKDPASVVRESPGTTEPDATPAKAGATRIAASAVASEVAQSAGGAKAVPADPVIAGVTITNPDRVLDPAGITKLELATYLDTVAPWMLPHVAGRLLTLVRCPHGTDGTAACFYQKHPEQRGWPEVFRPVRVRDKEGPATYFFIEDAAGLVTLAQMGTLEVHAWNSMASDPERPDRIVFDLDPGPGVEFPQVADAARVVRDALGALGLGAFVKTTGGHGLHVVTPIVPERGYDEVRAFARSIVMMLAHQRADEFTGLMRKAERPGRVFVDYLRNAHGATAVCALSTRARPGGRVSVPLAWDELGGVDPAAYGIDSVPRRLRALRSDPWAGYEDARAALSAHIVDAAAAAAR